MSAEKSTEKSGGKHMIRAAFFDIDGTLLPHSTGRVPASAEQAVRDLREKGIKVFAATGRHMLELEELPLDGLCFDGYILLNGQICSDGAGNLLYAVPVPADDTASLASLFEKCEVPVMFIEEKRMYMNFVNDRVRRVQADILPAVPEISAYSGALVYQCVVYVDETESRDLPRILPGCRITRWNSGAVDVISKDGSKVRGIQYMMGKYSLRQDEIIAFGDGENDREMLSFAGTGVAMRDASDAVKRCADYVTGSADGDGIREALKYYGIL